MNKAKKIIKNTRVIVLLVFLVLAVIAIQPRLETDGVAIRSVIKESAAQIAGIQNPKAGSSPMKREVIIAVGNTPIKTMEDYFAADRKARI